MAKVKIRALSISELRPSPRAITDGSPDPAPFRMWFGPRFGTLTMQVDRATARRFVAYRRLGVALFLLMLAILVTTTLLYGRGDALFGSNAQRLALLAFAVCSLILFVSPFYMAPKAFPRAFGATVWLSQVDEAAAREWQAANNSGAIIVKPDTPLLDGLARYLPPVVVAIVIVILALSLVR